MKKRTSIPAEIPGPHHALSRLILRLFNEEGIKYAEQARRAKVSQSQIKRWRDLEVIPESHTLFRVMADLGGANGLMEALVEAKKDTLAVILGQLMEEEEISELLMAALLEPRLKDNLAKQIKLMIDTYNSGNPNSP